MKARVLAIHTVFLSIASFLFLAATSLEAQKLLVVNAASETASVLNPLSGTVTKTVTVPAAASVVTAAINPSGTLGAVYADFPHRIDFYNLTDSSTTTSGSSVTLSGTFGTGPDRDIAFSTDGACVVATHGINSGGRVSSVNVASRTEVTVLTGVGPRAITAVPGHRSLILSAFAFFVSQLTLGGGCVLTDTTPDLFIPGAAGIQKIVPFPNGQGALLADVGGKVHVLSISSTGVVSYVKSITVGDTPQSIAITPDGIHAFVYKATTGSLRILAIDHFNNVTDSGTDLPAPASAFPTLGGITDAVTDGDSVFISSEPPFPGNTAITAINIFTRASRTITVGTFPAGMAIDVNCGHHTIHGHLVTSPPPHDAVSGIHHGQHGHLVTPGAECPPHAPFHSPGLTAETTGEGLFSTGGAMEAPDFVAGLDQDGTLNGNPGAGTKVQPAHRGTVVQLFGSAAGLFLDEQHLRAASGFTAPASGSPLFYTTSLPEVRIGGAPAQVLFSGLAPGLTGVWQINVLIPNAASAGAVPVTINYEGGELTSVSLAIE
ncbi:MAG TPA: hypothetical protein VEU62_13455 [Bryobacterales bacterium]|nr:hypothetical protein [Bryobacterales bacterium]